MPKKRTNDNAKYVEHPSKKDATHHHFLELEFDTYEGLLANDALDPEILESIYRGYMEEYREQKAIRTNVFQRVFRHAKAFIKHESYEVEPNSIPPVDAVVIRLRNPVGIDKNYLNHVYKKACLDEIKRSQTLSDKWNTVKEVANIVLPIPLGLAAFFSGYALGAEGVAWAAVAEFGPYAFIPIAIWGRGKEHKKRLELEEMIKSRKLDKELEETRTAMERYNTIKDINSFWIPVTFDSTLTGLSYLRVIPTPAGYMTGILGAPYLAHGLGFFAMLKEYWHDERAVILKKIMDTNLFVVNPATRSEEIAQRLQRY